jgi:hypothetical protein
LFLKWEELFSKKEGNPMKNSTDARTLNKISKPCRYSIPESKGLHLWVKKDGKKYWIFRY